MSENTQLNSLTQHAVVDVMHEMIKRRVDEAVTGYLAANLDALNAAGVENVHFNVELEFQATKT